MPTGKFWVLIFRLNTLVIDFPERGCVFMKSAVTSEDSVIILGYK